MRKKILIITIFILTTSLLAGCKANNSIGVVSREDGSGTRGAFTELFGIMQDGVDRTSERAEITNSTSVMMTTIAGNKNAIGYISLGSLNNTVKALKVDGATATTANVKSGEYKIFRPFSIAYLGGLSELGKDFIAFILSDQGQAVVESRGYIGEVRGVKYETSGFSGKLIVAGSSSVTPVMESLKEAYLALNPGVDLEIQQSDSSAGMTAVVDGVADIGMASRSLKESESEKGLIDMAIAIDGLAVIVNNDNPINDITSDKVGEIFMGELTDWGAIG